MLNESQKQKKSDDVFNNNTERVSKFPKRRTRINSSEDELDSDTGSNMTREKTRPKVPNKPQRLPSTGLNSDSPVGSPLSPKSPSSYSSAPRSPGLHPGGAPRSPGYHPGGAPRSPGFSVGAPKSPVQNALSKSPTLKPPTAKKPPPPVSPKPSTDSRLIHISSQNSVVDRPAVPPKPSRKSAPLSEVGKLALLDERKRSSSLSAAQDAKMASQDEICKTNSIIVLPKDEKRRNSDDADSQEVEDAEQGQITYPMSILRKKPSKPEQLKSCSDLMDADGIDLESLSGESRTSEFRDSIFESPMLKQFKKSQHFLIDQDSLPDYHKSNTTSVVSTASETDSFTYDPSILRRPKLSSTGSSTGEESPTSKVGPKFSKNPAMTNNTFSPPTKQKLGLKRSNAKRTKTPPSPNKKLTQHKSYDPKMLRQLKTKPSSAQMMMMSRHSDASGGYTNSDVFEEEEESSDSDPDHENEYEAIWTWQTARRDRPAETVSLTAEDVNFDFPPIPTLPNPRLEMQFNSPFDEIRRFLAYNRGPNEVFPVPRKSERGGKAMSRLKSMLTRLGG